MIAVFSGSGSDATAFERWDLAGDTAHNPNNTMQRYFFMNTSVKYLGKNTYFSSVRTYHSFKRAP
jgi:hypothetical protein